MTFSALSVEPYGDSRRFRRRRWLWLITFSALSVEPYGDSLSQARRRRAVRSFSALSVEPCAESAMTDAAYADRLGITLSVLSL